MNGFYFHPRAVLELYIKNPQLLAVCEVILCNARYNTAVVNEVTVNTGQCLMKYEELAKMCGVTVGQVRTALRRFVADGGISIENKGRKGILITLLPPFSCEAEKRAAQGNRESRPVYTKGTYKNKPDSVPDKNASYDLARAEERARSRVPELKKRVR